MSNWPNLAGIVTKVLSAAYRTGQVFGTVHLVDVLTGKATNKARQNGHEHLPTCGRW